MPDRETFLGEVLDPVTPDFRSQFYRAGDRLILRTHRASTGSSGERIWPLAVAGWLHAAIRDGFFAGGFGPRVTRVETTLAGERLELRRSWGFGGPDGRGFTLIQHDRLTRGGYPAEYPLTDEVLLAGGLLDLLGRIAAEAG